MNVHDQITTLRAHTEQLVIDFRLKAAGKQTRLYFDTVDVWNSVLGVDSFYQLKNGREFDRKLFESNHSLILCLASNNWFSSVRLLAPHQAEFLAWLEYRMRDSRNNSFRVTAEQFTGDCRVSKYVLRTSSDYQLDLEALANLGPLSSQGAILGRLFRVAQSLRGGHWKSRLSRGIARNVLVFDEPDLTATDYAQFTQSQIFVECMRYLRKHRSGLSINNFADAAAMAQLARMAEFADGSATNPIPQYFLPNRRDHLNLAIRELDLVTRIRCEVAGQQYSVFRTEDFFLHRAALMPPGQIRDPGRDAMTMNIDILEEFKAGLDSLLEYRSEATMIAAARGLKLGESDVLELIRRITGLSFLDRLTTGLDKLFDRGVSDAQQWKETQAGVEKELLALLEQFRTSVELYRRLGTLYAQIEEAVVNRPGGIPGRDLTTSALRWHHGLGRFGLSSDVIDDAGRLLRQLATADVQARASAIEEVLHFLVAAHEHPGERLQLLTWIAVLWVLGLHSAIHESLIHSPTDDVVVQELRLASLLLDKTRDSATIEQQFELLHSGITSRKVESGVDLTHEQFLRHSVLGFLYYGDALRRGFVAPWLVTTEMPALKPKSIESANRAVYFARLASNARAAAPEDERANVLNLLLFLITEVSVDSDWMREAGQLAAALEPFKYVEDIWNYRYDDTLARYHYRCASEATLISEQQFHLTLAHMHINMAMNARPTDPRPLQLMIDITKAMGSHEGKDWTVRS